jgi:integrase/recombinase XerD
MADITSTIPADLATFDATLNAFLRQLAAGNLSPATARAYKTDILQCSTFIQATNVALQRPDQVERQDLVDYLADLGARGVSGVSRARKLAAIRGYFRFLEQRGVIARSPAATIDTPKKERNGKTYLKPDEYNRLLSHAGAEPRDYAILQVFLQTGVRVSELCDLRRDDVDLEGRTLRVSSGKGMAARTIELEKKSAQALKTYISHRPETFDQHVFLNRYGEPISERGIRKLVAKYVRAGGITKKASCHSLRHTFATYKAKHGVSSYQLQARLGHKSLETTQLYVHLGRQNARKVMEETSL